ncbi:MAG: ABC transporter permease [Promethearchaeota archaeon]
MSDDTVTPDFETNVDEKHLQSGGINEFFRGLYFQFIGFFRWSNLRRGLIQIGWAIMSIFLAIFATSLIMLATGYNPFIAFRTLILGAFARTDLIFWYATPLIFTGLAVALAFQAGLFNIGAEGQLYMGSMAATVVGFMILLPPVIHPALALLFGFIIGGLWALVPALLKAYRGAHEVVTTMMMTFIATLFTQWLAAGPLQEPGQVQPQAQTPLIFPTAELVKLFGSNFLNFGFVIGIFVVIGVWILLRNTVLGYEMRAVGKNQSAAQAAGINPKKMIVISLFLSGCLAGLAGAVEILGYYHRFRDGWSAGLGFDGITVAVLGANNPIGVLLGAIFFGFLRAGAIPMQTIGGVPAEMVDVIQGLVVLFVAAPKIVIWLAKKGVTWAKRLVKDPMKAVPIFMGSIIAIIGSIASIAIGASMFGTLVQAGLIGDIFTLILTEPFFAMYIGLASLAVIIGLISLFAFYGLMTTQKWSTIALIPSAVIWIIIGYITMVMLGATLLIPLSVLGVLGIIFGVWSFILLYRQGVTFVEVKTDAD